MRKESEIRKKLRKLKFRYWSKFYKQHTKPLPENCSHNSYASGQSDIEGNYLCMLGAEDPTQWKGNICDTEEFAQGCPYFQCRFSKEQLKDDFEEALMDNLFVDFRDVAILMWVLDIPIREDTHYHDDENWLALLKARLFS
jgi:hypothetical protein